MRRVATNLNGVTALASAVAGRTERCMRFASVAAGARSDPHAATGGAHMASVQITRQRVRRTGLDPLGRAAGGGDPAVLTRVSL